MLFLVESFGDEFHDSHELMGNGMFTSESVLFVGNELVSVHVILQSAKDAAFEELSQRGHVFLNLWQHHHVGVFPWTRVLAQTQCGVNDIG